MTTYYFDNLTTLCSDSNQSEFINNTNDYIILNSCAGSGKTRCLILKLKFLIDKYNINGSDLIICSFTRAMANSIKFRIKYHFDKLLDGALIGTFHSICYNLIKPIIFGDKTSDLTSHEEILVHTYELIQSNVINLSSKYLIIDEYQDLNIMSQKIINHLLSNGKIRGLFLIGDQNQSIYTYYNNSDISEWLDKLNKIKISQFSSGTRPRLTSDFESKLNKLNIQIVKPAAEGTSAVLPSAETNPHFEFNRLSTNYRSTMDIINLANCFLNEPDQMISAYTYNKYKPKLIIFDRWSSEIEYLCQTIQTYINSNRFKKLGSIGILSRYNKTLEYIEDKLLGMGIGCNYIKYNNKIQPYGINLSTIHSAKGLEFDNVYFINCSYNTNPTNDKIYAEEIRLMYVCLTRARKQLILTSNKTINHIIQTKVLSNESTKDYLIIIDNRSNEETHSTSSVETSSVETSSVKKSSIKITSEEKIISNLNEMSVADKHKSWIGVTELVKLLGGEHIINIKKILSPIMNFKPVIKQLHPKLNKIPQIFKDIKNISNIQNVFGIFIDTLITRHVQYKLAQLNNTTDPIKYLELDKLVLLYYLGDKSDINELNLVQIAQLKKLYNMTDSIFKSNLLLDKSTYSVPRISSNFEKMIRNSYLKFSDPSIPTIEILYDIFIISLSSSVLNERLAYQYLPQYIKPEDINSCREWYEDIIKHIDQLVETKPDIEVQKELSNHYMKIIGYSDIVVPKSNLIIDIKTSIFEYPKLEYLLQIIIYGMLSSNPINRFQIYNPIYGIEYEWSFRDDRINKIYSSTIINKLIDYISSILSDINKKRIYNV